MKIIKDIIKYKIIAGLFIIPFIAFIVPDNMFFPFISGKGFTFRILVEILFGLYVVLAFIDTEYRPKFSWITKSLLLFVGITFIADILGENSYKSIWSNFERMEGFVLLAHLLLYYIVLSSFFKTQTWWNRFFNANIVASAIMVIYGLVQISGNAVINQGGERLDATFGNAIYLAIYMVFSIFLCFYMMFTQSKQVWQKWMYGIVAFFEVIILYYTATRSAILGFIGGLILVGLIIVIKERNNLFVRKIAFGILAGVAILVLGFVSIKDTEYVKTSKVLSRFSTLSFSEIKTQGRYYVWPMAIEGFKERPLLGWGQENFNFVFNKYYDPGLYGQEEWFDRTHNILLDKLVEGGILGFLSYISIFVAFFYYIWRRKSTFSLNEKAILTAMISAYIFHNLFVFDNLISYIIFFSLLAYVHYVATKDEICSGSFYTKTINKDLATYLVLPVVTMVTLGTVYFVNIPALSANFTLIEAMKPRSDGDVSKNLDLFKKVFSYNSFANTEATEQITQTAVQISSPQVSVAGNIKDDFYKLAKQKLEEKITSQPNDARYLVFAGSFFNRFSQYNDALKYLEAAKKESPKKISIFFELGTTYLGLNQPEKMMALFKEAHYLRSTSETQLVYAVGAIYTRNEAVLKEMFSKLDPKQVINDSRILKAYSDIGDYNNAIFILKTRIENDPKDLQNKLLLASVYSTVGQKQNAISLIREIIEAEPSFKDQGEIYIQQIQSQ